MTRGLPEEGLCRGECGKSQGPLCEDAKNFFAKIFSCSGHQDDFSEKKNDLKMKPYKLHCSQYLTEENKKQRYDVCKWIIDEEIGPHKIIFH